MTTEVSTGEDSQYIQPPFGIRGGLVLHDSTELEVKASVRPDIPMERWVKDGSEADDSLGYRRQLAQIDINVLRGIFHPHRRLDYIGDVLLITDRASGSIPKEITFAAHGLTPTEVRVLNRYTDDVGDEEDSSYQRYDLERTELGQVRNRRAAIAIGVAATSVVTCVSNFATAAVIEASKIPVGLMERIATPAGATAIAGFLAGLGIKKFRDTHAEKFPDKSIKRTRKEAKHLLVVVDVIEKKIARATAEGITLPNAEYLMDIKGIFESDDPDYTPYKEIVKDLKDSVDGGLYTLRPANFVKNLLAGRTDEEAIARWESSHGLKALSKDLAQQLQELSKIRAARSSATMYRESPADKFVVQEFDDDINHETKDVNLAILRIMQFIQSRDESATIAADESLR